MEKSAKGLQSTDTSKEEEKTKRLEKNTEDKAEKPEITKEEKKVISEPRKKEQDTTSYLSKVLIWTFAIITGIFVISTISMILLDKNGDIDEFIELYRDFIVPVAALLGASFGYFFSKSAVK